MRGDDGWDKCTKCGVGMRACEVCCPLPARLCESCRITSCTPIGALISTVVDKDRYHHKCNTIVLPAEPTADKLREWIFEVKERVRNAFSFDSDYALAWISETERLDYDALGGPCKYPVLDSNFMSAIRECIKTRAVRDKMNRLTEAAQNMIPPQGIKGRQILKLLLNHLQTGVEDDQTFKIAELTSLKCRQTGHSDDESRLRSYLSTWDNLIYGIKKKIDDGVLLAVFIENVRHLRCMRPDIERWDRDETVRSFSWLYKACQDCVERWQKRQNTLQMYQNFHEQRSRSGWNAGCMPTLTCPSGRTVTLDVINNNVPYLPHGDTQFVSPVLDDGEPLPAMPAPGVAYHGIEANEAPAGEPMLANENGSQDTWRTERSGHVVKEHRLPRRAKFVPTEGDCPVRVDQLNSYRKTIVHRNGVTHEVLIDALWELSERDQHAIASDVPWTGETWFQVKCESVALPGEAEQGGEGDSRSPPVPGPGEGDYGDIVEINFLSGLRTEAEWRACSRIFRRTRTARTASAQRWRTSNFVVQAALLRMTWQTSGT